MSYFDNMHLRMSGKTIGEYTGTSETYHGFFGHLTPKCQVVLPDDWDFQNETLFKKVEKHQRKRVKNEFRT